MWPPVGTQGGGGSAELREAGNQVQKGRRVATLPVFVAVSNKDLRRQCFLSSGYISLFCDAEATDGKKKVKKKGKIKKEKEKNQRGMIF